MALFNRRLFFWLLRAYIKKWGKIIIFFFILGLIIFFILRSSLPYIISQISGVSKVTIGITGSYTADNLPTIVSTQVARGLTKIDSNGIPKPDLASSWQMKDDGKTYIFHLKQNLFYTDGSPFVSTSIPQQFSDVKTTTPDKYTIIYHLNESYSPFLVSASRPIFKNGYIGVGEYQVKSINLNDSFIVSVALASSIYQPRVKIYNFYPTDEGLKVAFALGQISVAQNLESLSFKNTSISKFANVDILKSIDYTRLVTLFYNTKDSNLSNKSLRDALSYALPNSFKQGQRAYSPIPPTSWAYELSQDRSQDFTHSKLLLSAALGEGKLPTLYIQTLGKYYPVAKIIQGEWKKIGITSKISTVDSVPDNFQIYLGDFTVPTDPDQYTLWHSFEANNITHYNSPRIDKLLEDGRKTVDTSQRLKDYVDFQKYLIDDQPASFLYFPYSYSVTRK